MGGKIITLIAGVFAIASVAAERKWTDEKTGREFIILDGKMSRHNADAICREKKLTLFDWRFLSDEEKEGFWKREEFDAFEWPKQYEGTPREFRTGEIWQANSFGTSNYFIGVVKKKDKTVVKLEQATRNANAICMSVEDFWYECTGWWYCKSSGGSHMQAVTDYGSSQAEASKRIVEATERVASPQCSLDLSAIYCQRVLP